MLCVVGCRVMRSNMRNLIGLLKFMWGTVFSYLIYIMLHSLDVLSAFNKDLCPLLSMKQISLGVGLSLLLLLLWSKMSSLTSGLHIAIKKYESTICICMFTFGIIIWEKCRTQPLILMIY